MKTTLIFAMIMCASFAHATDVELVVQKIDNQGLVPGQTYRVYARIIDPEKNIHAVFGDEQNPLSIQTTTEFYQNSLGSHCAHGVNPAIFSVEPALAFDSWITIGYEDAQNSDHWELGVDFASFNTGQSIHTTNGAWFLLPTDDRCFANAEGLLLLAQFTSTGVVSGTINVQGWHGANNNWQARGLTFTTENTPAFGCTDPLAANYSAAALFDDGSCAAEATVGLASSVQHESLIMYPNPTRMPSFTLEVMDFPEPEATVSVTNASGAMVHSRHVTLQGNTNLQVQFDNMPAAGTYLVTLRGVQAVWTGQLIVQ